MRVYFEDGVLREDHNIPESSLKINMADARMGYSFCNVTLGYCFSNYPDGIVYTNSISGLNPLYSWDGSLKRYDLYMRDGADRWVNAEALLKDSEKLDVFSDIPHMYMHGYFSRRR